MPATLFLIAAITGCRHSTVHKLSNEAQTNDTKNAIRDFEKRHYWCLHKNKKPLSHVQLCSVARCEGHVQDMTFRLTVLVWPGRRVYIGCEGGSWKVWERGSWCLKDWSEKSSSQAKIASLHKLHIDAPEMYCLQTQSPCSLACCVFIHKAKLFFFFLQRWFRGAVKTQALTSVPNASATTSKSVSVLHMFLKVNKKKRSHWYS